MVRRTIAFVVLIAIMGIATLGSWMAIRHYYVDSSSREPLDRRPLERLKQGDDYRVRIRSPRGGRVHWGHSSRDGRPCAFAYRYHPPERVPVTAEQSNAVARAFNEIVASYRKGDVSAMRARIMEMPDVVSNMTEKAFVGPAFTAVHAMEEGFTMSRELKEFATPIDFMQYCRINIDFALFVGNVFLMREDYESPMSQLDFRVLQVLLRYKDDFHAKGRMDMELAVDSFISEWETQIESENGFTRQYMWYQVDLQWACYNDGEWTLAQLSEWAKRYAKGLVRLGYTPKWLSEFDDLSEAVK